MSETKLPQNRITVLDEHTANRIAAGEVIERPASVVKELVENSIDAGATQIWITIEEGGKELIKISDNGIGMSREDAIISLQRHATSKIRTADDLFDIHTLGFRGEALPSIASVSIMEIVTKREADAAASRLEIEAGTITNLESIGAPNGTTITVKRLFFNTPARMKFLRASQTELSHITDLIGKLSLAYPNVSFKLMHGSREVMSVTGTGDLLNAAAAVYGRDVAKQLIPIRFETQPITVWGYVSKPSFTRANRGLQVFFVNRRPIRNRALTAAADQSYKDLIVQPGRYPALIIFIDVDPQLVDVNVHPTKAEVKFSREQDAYGVAYKAIRDALMSGGAIPTMSTSRTPAADRRDEPSPQVQLIRPEESDVAAFRDAVMKRSQPTEIGTGEDPFDWRSKLQSQPVQEPPVNEIEAPVQVQEPLKLGKLKVIGQARNMYILAESDDGVVIIDQHVAHERVLFEQLSKSRSGENVVMQRLMIPITLELSRREGLVVNERLEDLKSIGFDIEPFGRDSFMVRAVPANVKPKNAEPFLRDIIAELVETSVAKHIIVRLEQVLITTACKMAVKAGDPLAMPEMEDLVKKLLETDNPFVCPHGRPIIISLTNWELDRKFKRPAQPGS